MVLFPIMYCSFLMVTFLIPLLCYLLSICFIFLVATPMKLFLVLSHFDVLSKPINQLIILLFSFCFAVLGIEPRVFTLRYIAFSFYFYFEMESFKLLTCPGCAWTCDYSVLASQSVLPYSAQILFFNLRMNVMTVSMFYEYCEF